ncbi:MAG: hypothetical protein OEZ29_05880 [Candidatus Bathyarchaeota archaeon]|nr:hypothetical protein [Candidatus Bathyarchaeota archaeon]
MQKQNGDTYNIPLRKLLNILHDAKEALEFTEIYQRSGLTKPCLSRRLRKGEKLGLFEKIIAEERTTRGLKLSWRITQKGRRIRNLYEIASRERTICQ